jgi:hypothetical protein
MLEGPTTANDTTGQSIIPVGATNLQHIASPSQHAGESDTTYVVAAKVFPILRGPFATAASHRSLKTPVHLQAYEKL